MRKHMVLLLTGLLCLGLSGCAAGSPPEQAADGSPWDEGWVTVGGVVGADAPEGMELRDNNEALAANGMYYATWSIGESEPYINEDEDEVELYDAQLYLLLSGGKSSQDAENTLTQWIELAQRQYSVSRTVKESHNGQDFTILTYSFDSETNPYAQGVSAFGVYRDYAISVELTCRETFDGDIAQLLTGFLDSCHYAAQ